MNTSSEHAYGAVFNHLRPPQPSERIYFSRRDTVGNLKRHDLSFWCGAPSSGSRWSIGLRHWSVTISSSLAAVRALSPHPQRGRQAEQGGVVHSWFGLERIRRRPQTVGLLYRWIPSPSLHSSSLLPASPWSIFTSSLACSPLNINFVREHCLQICSVEIGMLDRIMKYVTDELTSTIVSFFFQVPSTSLRNISIIRMLTVVFSGNSTSDILLCWICMVMTVTRSLPHSQWTREVGGTSSILISSSDWRRRNPEWWEF